MSEAITWGPWIRNTGTPPDTDGPIRVKLMWGRIEDKYLVRDWRFKQEGDTELDILEYQLPVGSPVYEKQEELSSKDSGNKEQSMRFNEGKPELSYILDAMPALKDMVAVMEFGAKKYERNNWRRGFSKEKLLDSLLRHVDAFYSGEDLDPESGLLHVGHILCNAVFLGYHFGSESDYWECKYNDQP